MPNHIPACKSEFLLSGPSTVKKGNEELRKQISCLAEWLRRPFIVLLSWLRKTIFLADLAEEAIFGINGLMGRQHQGSDGGVPVTTRTLPSKILFHQRSSSINGNCLHF